MTNRKTTKRALFSSVISLILCLSMLVGTTFAWFTDSVSSGVNQIVAGNLDIELDYYDAVAKEWKTVDGATELFEGSLWEPGHTEVVYLRVSNKGNLAFKYQMGINVVSETTAINVDDKPFKLSSYIQYGIAEVNGESDAYENRADAIAALTSSKTIANGYSDGGVMVKDQAPEYVALVVYMPETVGNEANYKTGTQAPVINLGINVIATQQTEEEDSFDELYDAGAAWDGTASYDWYLAGEETGTYTLTDASDLAGLAAIVNGTAEQSAGSGVALLADEVTYVQDSFKGKTVALAENVNLNNAEWTPIGNSTYKFEGTFDGQNKIVSNLYISGYNSNAGLFGFTQNGSVKNLTVNNASVSGRTNVGVVAGTPYTSTYDNITVSGDVYVNGLAYVGGVFGKNVYADVSNITVDVKPGSLVTANSIEDGGAYRSYVGGVVGFMAEGGHTVSNVTSNIDVVGSTCDIGGIAGIVHYGNKFENITCTGNVTGNDAAENEIGGIAGVWHNGGADVTLTNCSYTGTITLAGKTIVSQLVGPAYSASGNGKLIIDGVPVVSNTADLKEALTAQNSTVHMAGGEYTMSSIGSGTTVVGSEGTVVTATGNSAVPTSMKNNTFKNITFTGSNAARYTYTTGDVVFENCVFDGDVYGYHVDDAHGGTITFNNCTFIGFNAFAATGTYYFNDCTFLHSGSYGHTNIWGVGYFNDCTFGDKTSVSTAGSGTVYMNDVEESYHHEYVGSAASLTNFASTVNEGDSWDDQEIILISDIDLGGTAWTPIGISSSKGFSGTFNGNGHTISNFKMALSSVNADDPNRGYGAGLFGNLLSGAVIENLTVENVTGEGRWNCCGIVAGYVYGDATFDNVHVNNSTLTGVAKLGGILGMAADPGAHNLKVTNCSVKNTTINGTYNLGGLVGLVLQENIVDVTGSTAEVTINLVDKYFGGEFVTLKDGNNAWLYSDWYYSADAKLYCYYGTDAENAAYGAEMGVDIDALFCNG